MNIEEFREYCLSIKGSEESISLQTSKMLVFKVMGKVFVYFTLEPEDGIFKAYLKCDPERSVDLREKYNGISPDKFKTFLWNWITLESDVPNELMRELIRHSADEVINKLPKKKQEEYFNMLFMEIRTITENKRQFLDLLLLGDESEDMIDHYLDRGDMFTLYDGDLKAVCVVTN